MKRKFTVLITVLVVGVLCACGNKDGKQQESKSGIADAVVGMIAEKAGIGEDIADADIEEALVAMVAEAGESNSEACEDTKSSKEDNKEKDNKKNVTTENKSSDFTATVLVDNDSVRIEAVDEEWDDDGDYKMNFLLENKTDKDLVFTSEYADINGWEVIDWLHSRVDAGKKTYDYQSVSKETLDNLEIEDITRVALRIRVYECDSYEDVLNERYVIYPQGIEADMNNTREILPTDIVLVDNEDISIIITERNADDEEGYRLNLYFENKTDNCLCFCAKDQYLNDFMCETNCVEKLIPGEKMNSSLYWSSDKLEKQRMLPTDVTDIMVTFRVYDAKDKEAEDIFTQTFNIKAR